MTKVFWRHLVTMNRREPFMQLGEELEFKECAENDFLNANRLYQGRTFFYFSYRQKRIIYD